MEKPRRTMVATINITVTHTKGQDFPLVQIDTAGPHSLQVVGLAVGMNRVQEDSLSASAFDSLGSFDLYYNAMRALERANREREDHDRTHANHYYKGEQT